MNALNFLKTSRAQLLLTQKELAAITGYKLQQIVDYENQRARVPGDLVLQLQAMLRAQKKQSLRNLPGDRVEA